MPGLSFRDIRMFVFLSSAFLFLITVQAQAANIIVTSTGNGGTIGNLLHFNSADHVLGFGHDSFYVAGMGRVLGVKHVGGSPVHPVAEGTQACPDGVPALVSVAYSGVWDGVDVLYKAAANGIFESFYHVRNTEHGLPVDKIRLRYNRPLGLDEKGNLVTAFENGNMVESAPVAWQEVGGEKRFVDAAFVLYGKDEVGFALGDCLPGIPVVIDPVLTWNTFLGSPGHDRGVGITSDGSGNVYVTGNSAASWGSPMRGHQGGSDAFVAKLDGGTGALIWHTFLGSPEADAGAGIALDDSGNVFVIGFSTASWQGTHPPVRPYAGGADAFAAKLDGDGNLLWNTFLGGSGNDTGHGIALDDSGNLYVAGSSDTTWQGTNPPVRPYEDSTDAFVTRLNGTTGVLEGNTFLGGSGDDHGYGIALDGSGNLYVVGQSSASWGSPHRPFSGNRDAFVAMVNGTTGDGFLFLEGNGFLGGSGDDCGHGIAIDGSGHIHVVGQSSASWGSPIRPHAGNFDAFALKLNGATAALETHTFMGGSGDDYCNGVVLDHSGNTYVTGYSDSSWGSPLRGFSGNTDAFSARLNSVSGTMDWNTFLGGSGVDLGHGITVGGRGVLYVTGYSDSTWGSPVLGYTEPDYDCFVARLTKAGQSGVLMLLLDE